MQDGPSSAPRAAVPPDTDESRAGLLIGMVAGFLSLALIFVMLRVYVRFAVLKRWGADDTLVVVSYILALVTGVLFGVGTRFGLGAHIGTIPPEQHQPGRRLVISATLTYQATFIIIKMAFLQQFRRVFTVRKFRIFCDIMSGFITIFGLAILASFIVINAPGWRGDSYLAEKEQGAWWLSTSVVHLITDIVIFLMPIPLLSRLKLKRPQKVVLVISFGIGFLTTGISVVRVSTLPHVFTGDVTWDVIPALIWSEVEICCAVICACIPTLRPLLQTKGFGPVRTMRLYDRQISEASCEARLTRKPNNRGTFGSQQSIMPSTPLSGGVMEAEPEMQTVTGTASSESVMTMRTEISLVLTAGGSDDWSIEFMPMEEEDITITPLSPPPKSFASPILSRTSADFTADDRSYGSHP
ncbi:hypothetical protein CCHL11_03734 [Colletotrichum chlorophyti]|uniref:Rhodopsin domain-containing protein n=1 Tax=Colletotrichum chlorophyti TaxID=708187 RepID=A0A1Q8RQP7_9PEZI|nr:hypothetical protein CCHL11_03734 [Colletotrichum chlorophyti]